MTERLQMLILSSAIRMIIKIKFQVDCCSSISISYSFRLGILDENHEILISVDQKLLIKSHNYVHRKDYLSKQKGIIS